MNELNQHRRVLTLFSYLSYDSADLVVVTRACERSRVERAGSGARREGSVRNIVGAQSGF